MRRQRSIFLSAGVPDPSATHFMGEGDVAAISALVSALLFVALGRRPIVWGGHPAITPMIWAYAEALDVDYGQWVTLYQSEYFKDDFPEENARFGNVVVTEAVPGDRERSLEAMRRRMLSERIRTERSEGHTADGSKVSRHPGRTGLCRKAPIRQE